ncbi:MAG: subclass B3 metallo-beta-lactamase [Dokdonella sp.]
MTHSLSVALALAIMLTQPLAASAAQSWSQPQEPAHIYGNAYYVGTVGLSSVLIHTDAGAILLDGTLDKSAPLVEANIRALGFKVEDVKLILSSHAHFDHAGGIAALQHDSGATVVASPSGARALRLGHAVDDDPQAGYVKDSAWPTVAQVREVHDGEIVRLGDVAVTAHFTPGHTPGSTTWTWRSCESRQCLNVVYADSLNPISAPGFHFLADATHPDLTASMRKSIHTVANLPCDILISVHPDIAGVDKKLQQLAAKPAANPFIDPQACRAYADSAEKLLDARIAEEKSGK